MAEERRVIIRPSSAAPRQPELPGQVVSKASKQSEEREAASEARAVPDKRSGATVDVAVVTPSLHPRTSQSDLKRKNG